MQPPPKAIIPPPARPLIIVAGPTASGKSALALDLATHFGGTIINADAMQCYADWRIITARPTPADEAAAPHRLYGVRSFDQPVDAAWWRQAALHELWREGALHELWRQAAPDELWRQAALDELTQASLPILCGGTGLYLTALIDGISAIPYPAPQARTEARTMLADHGPAWLHHWLMTNDPKTGAKLRPTDSQRLARAAEVLIATGQGLAHWHAQPRDRLTGFRPILILLDPPRTTLRTAIETRFAAMLNAGALAEIAAVAARNPDPSLPGLRAHGVPELFAHLQGTISLDHAAASAIAATFAYTKRQATWFRHQKLAPEPDTLIINARYSHAAQFSESINHDIISFINNRP